MDAAPNPDFSPGAGPLGLLALARQAVRGHHHLSILLGAAQAAAALTLAAATAALPPRRPGAAAAAQATAEILLHDLQEGQAEGGRLAATRLGRDHDVPAAQDKRDGLVLRHVWQVAAAVAAAAAAAVREGPDNLGSPYHQQKYVATAVVAGLRLTDAVADLLAVVSKLDQHHRAIWGERKKTDNPLSAIDST